MRQGGRLSLAHHQHGKHQERRGQHDEYKQQHTRRDEIQCKLRAGKRARSEMTGHLIMSLNESTV